MLKFKLSRTTVTVAQRLYVDSGGFYAWGPAGRGGTSLSAKSCQKKKRKFILILVLSRIKKTEESDKRRRASVAGSRAEPVVAGPPGFHSHNKKASLMFPFYRPELWPETLTGGAIQVQLSSDCTKMH